MPRLLLCATVFLHLTAASDYFNRVHSSRSHDVWHAVEDDVTYDNKIHISMKIQEAECFSASTESSFVVYLGSMSYENEFLSWFAILSVEGVRVDGIWEFEITRDPTNLPEECFASGREDCVPAADVIFIQYHNEPEDSWSIASIEIDVQFRLWRGNDNYYLWKYQHEVMKPCISWMEETALYQIGPRNGLFIKLDEAPTPGKWIRDWI